MNGRKSIKKRYKGRLYFIQKGLCFYCGNATKFNQMIGEHRIPVSRGGTNARNNYVLSCHRCDQEKGSMTDSEYIEKRGVAVKALETFRQFLINKGLY